MNGGSPRSAARARTSSSAGVAARLDDQRDALVAVEAGQRRQRPALDLDDRDPQVRGVQDELLERGASLRDDEQADRRPARDERLLDRSPAGDELFVRPEVRRRRQGRGAGRAAAVADTAGGPGHGRRSGRSARAPLGRAGPGPADRGRTAGAVGSGAQRRRRAVAGRSGPDRRSGHGPSSGASHASRRRAGFVSRPVVRSGTILGRAVRYGGRGAAFGPRRPYDRGPDGPRSGSRQVPAGADLPPRSLAPRGSRAAGPGGPWPIAAGRPPSGRKPSGVRRVVAPSGRGGRRGRGPFGPAEPGGHSSRAADRRARASRGPRLSRGPLSRVRRRRAGRPTAGRRHAGRPRRGPGAVRAACRVDRRRAGGQPRPASTRRRQRWPSRVSSTRDARAPPARRAAGPMPPSREPPGPRSARRAAPGGRARGASPSSGRTPSTWSRSRSAASARRASARRQRARLDTAIEVADQLEHGGQALRTR